MELSTKAPGPHSRDLTSQYKLISLLIFHENWIVWSPRGSLYHYPYCFIWHLLMSHSILWGLSAVLQPAFTLAVTTMIT